jgi:hypothetical protein
MAAVVCCWYDSVAQCHLERQTSSPRTPPSPLSLPVGLVTQGHAVRSSTPSPGGFSERCQEAAAGSKVSAP